MSRAFEKRSIDEPAACPQVSAGTLMQLQWVLRLGGVCIAVMGIWYLTLLNALATQGFDLEELKAERIDIQRQMEEIDIALAMPTTLYALESMEKVQYMDDVEERIFIEADLATTALR